MPTDEENIRIAQAQAKFYCLVCHKNHRLGECEFEGLCKFCKERPATIHYGDMLSFTHGGELNSCELCVAEKQLEHAEERAAAIPELEQKVEELEFLFRIRDAFDKDKNSP